MKFLLEVSHGEWLTIKRRREGLDQMEMAEKMGLTRHQYQAKEANPNGKLKRRLAANEAAFLMRRRSKKSQSAVAKELGLSRLWVNRMEMGLEECDRLLDFWNLRQ